MKAMRAVVVDPNKTGRLTIEEFPPPMPVHNEAIVRVHAISLNRGEVRNAMSAAAGLRPGWDLAGIVETAAADGSGPKAGTRIVGLVAGGAWAQLAAVPTHALAELPADVSFEIASTLPVAGLTALHTLYKGGFLTGRTILITGATGGTGDFLIQLAKVGGAKVVAIVRSKDREAIVRGYGADEVVVGDDPSEAAKFGPFALIVDSVGGPMFGKLIPMLAVGGTLVLFGVTAGAELKFNGIDLYRKGGASIYGLIVFEELKHEPASVGLNILAKLASAGKLKPRSDVTEPWTNIADVAKRLTDRAFVGKAVLKVD